MIKKNMSKVVFVATIFGMLKVSTGALTLRPKAIQHPFSKGCEIFPTDKYDQYLVICTKTYLVYLKNLITKNVTPWVYCLPEPYMALYLFDANQTLIVCKQHAIQSPIELICEPSPLSPKNLKCDETYIFDGQLPSTSFAKLLTRSESDTVSTHANNHSRRSDPFEASNYSFLNSTWATVFGIMIFIIFILLICFLLLRIYFHSRKLLQRRKANSNQQPFLPPQGNDYAPACVTPKKGTTESQK